MTTEDLNAPTGTPPSIGPSETVATEAASIHPLETPPVVETETTGTEITETEPATTEQQAGDDKTEEKPALTWQEKRRIEETNKRRAAEAELARVNAELAALRKANGAPATTTTEQAPAATPAQPAATLSPEQARAAARAEIEAEERARAFTEATGRVLSNGLAAIPDFEQARQDMVNNFGEQLTARPDFFEAITSLENGHEVFYDLAKSPEETERILSLSPVKLALEIAKRGTKAPEAPAPKPISKAPAPVKPVGGNAQTSTRLDDENAPMDQWAQNFLKQVAGRGR